MPIIAGTDLDSLVEGGVVENTIDLSLQVQMCGVELTLQRIDSFTSPGALDFNNLERQNAGSKAVPFDADGWVTLASGAYLVTFNEVVRIPDNMAALARPRSSLLRSGATLATALWDPGYKGRSQSLLLVHNDHGLRLKRDARLMQLVFLQLSETASRLYQGAYQGENL